MGQDRDPIRTVSWCEAHGGLAEDVQRVLARIDTERPGWGTYACGTCRQRRGADPAGVPPEARSPMSGPHPGTRQAEWTINPERDGAGHALAPVHEVQCRTCDEMSEPDPEQGRTDLWAAQHTDLTGHRAYREITTTPLVAHPAPTNPLYERETARRDA